MQEVLAKILPNVLSFREKLHRYPELGYEEHITTDLIVNKLVEIGIYKIETKYSKTGVVGVIEADKAQGTIAIRADIDAIMITTQVVNAINSFRARNIDPFEPVVLSLGTINSRGRYNIICPQVDIEGTIRTLNEDIRYFIGKKLVEIVVNAANAMDGSGKINILRGYDVLKNDEKLTDMFIELTKSLLGDDKVSSNVKPSMISEDFAFYAKQVPATYFFLGCESPHPLHSSQFFPNEGCIEIGIKVLTNLVLNDFLGIDEKQSETC